MRKMLVLLAVAAVAVVAATAAFAGGAPGLTAPRVIHVVERPVTDQVIDIGAKGDSPGDQLPFANPIYDGSNSHRVGSDQGNCVRASASQGRWECMWTTFLRGGQITVEGPFIDSKTNDRAGGHRRHRCVPQRARADAAACPRRRQLRLRVLTAAIRHVPTGSGSLAHVPRILTPWHTQRANAGRSLRG